MAYSDRELLARLIQLIENEPYEKVIAVATNFLRGIRKALDS